MKTLTLLALAAALPAGAAAQSHGLPVPSFKIVNALVNPGFELNSLAPWTQIGDSRPSGWNTAFNPTPAGALGYRRAGGHSGGYAYAFGAAFSYNPALEHYGVVHQDLATPMSGAAVFGATAWVWSVGQTIVVRVNYADGTSSTAGLQVPTSITPDPKDTGWRQWDFSKAIDPNKTVKSLDFSVYTNFAFPYDVLLDDVFIGKLVPIGK